MKPVSIREARKRLGELVDAVERGETIVLTRRGVEVAHLGPVPCRHPGLPDLTEFRASLGITGTPLSEVVTECREAERA